MEKEVLLFDLDGTIVDSSKGIFASINYAMEKLEKEALSLDVLRSFVGPPLLDSFLKVGLPWEQANLAVTYYRELYKKEAMYFVDPYEKIEETLMNLAEKKKIFIATSKPEYFATKILEYLDFAKYFEGIYGADLEGKRTEKAAVIQYVLNSEKSLSLPQTVMIGDRKHDIQGATINKLDSIGVLYGFGDAEELIQAGATELVTQPIDLLTLIK